MRYELGDIVRGTIHMDQTEPFGGEELQVGMQGAEFTFFKGKGDESQWSYSGKNTFLHSVFTVNKYYDAKEAPVGKSSFNFAFRIADWLPETFIYASDFNRQSVKRAYSVFAEVVPKHAHDYADAAKTISIFRGSQDIHVLRRHVEVPQKELSTEVISKVGGVMGLGSSLAKTVVIFNQSIYYPGEICKVRIICDNSKCSSAVKSFKLKFKRKIYISGERKTGSNDMVKEVQKSSKYLYQHKDTEHGCGAK